MIKWIQIIVRMNDLNWMIQKNMKNDRQIDLGKNKLDIKGIFNQKYQIFYLSALNTFYKLLSIFSLKNHINHNQNQYYSSNLNTHRIYIQTINTSKSPLQIFVLPFILFQYQTILPYYFYSNTYHSSYHSFIHIFYSHIIYYSHFSSNSSVYFIFLQYIIFISIKSITTLYLKFLYYRTSNQNLPILYIYFKTIMLKQKTPIRNATKRNQTHYRNSSSDEQTGVLSRLDRLKCIEYFNSFKKTGSNTLKKEDFKQVLKGLGYDVSQQDNRTAKQQLDYGTFQKIMVRYKGLQQLDSLEDIQNAYDYLLNLQRERQNREDLQQIGVSTLVQGLNMNFGIKVNLKILCENLSDKISISLQDFKGLITKKQHR